MRQKGSPITYIFAALFIALIVAMYLAGCAVPSKPPVVLPTPGTTPVIHIPLCGAGNVSACWHLPPWGWRYNCAGGAPTVLSPAECPGVPPVATPPVVEDPTSCPADAPDATGYRWYQGNKANPAVKMVCAIAVTKAPEWCEPRFDDPRQHGTCSYFPEGHPRRDACLKTKGKPTFIGPISVREDNEICGDVAVGDTITACAPSGACGSYTVTP